MSNHDNRPEKTPAGIAATRLENLVIGEIPSLVYLMLVLPSPDYQPRDLSTITLSEERTRYWAPTMTDIDMKNGVGAWNRLLQMRGAVFSTRMALLLDHPLDTHLDQATRYLWQEVMDVRRLPLQQKIPWKS
jgi:hypothetical protein